MSCEQGGGSGAGEQDHGGSVTPLEIFGAIVHDEPGHLGIDSDMAGALALSVEHDYFESPAATICT